MKPDNTWDWMMQKIDFAPARWWLKFLLRISLLFCIFLIFSTDSTYVFVAGLNAYLLVHVNDL